MGDKPRTYARLRKRYEPPPEPLRFENSAALLRYTGAVLAAHTAFKHWKIERAGQPAYAKQLMVLDAQYRSLDPHLVRLLTATRKLQLLVHASRRAVSAIPADVQCLVLNLYLRNTYHSERTFFGNV